MQQPQHQVASSSVQRGSSAKHQRSKTVTNPPNLQYPQQQHHNNYMVQGPQGIQYPLAAESQQFATSSAAAAAAVSAHMGKFIAVNGQATGTAIPSNPEEQPKRTLKPKDLNNRSTALQTNDSRKCVTPLAAEKDSRKKHNTTTTGSTRPSSKEHRNNMSNNNNNNNYNSKSNKINTHQQSRLTSQQQQQQLLQQQNSESTMNNGTNTGLTNSSSKPTTKPHAATWNPAQNTNQSTANPTQFPSNINNLIQQSSNVGKNTAAAASTSTSNTLRGTVNQKLNTSLTNANTSFTHSQNNKEVLQLLGPHAATGQQQQQQQQSHQQQRKTSIASAKNVVILPHSNKPNTITLTLQPSSTTTPSASAQLNGSFAQSGGNLHLKAQTQTQQTRQRRANKSVHQSSSSSTYNNAAMAIAATMINGGNNNNNINNNNHHGLMHMQHHHHTGTAPTGIVYPYQQYATATQPQRQNSSQTVMMQPSLHHQRSASNYAPGTFHNSSSSYSTMPSFIQQDIININSNNNNNNNEIFIGQGVQQGHPPHVNFLQQQQLNQQSQFLAQHSYLPANQQTFLSMSLNQSDDAQFIYSQARFPMTTGSYGSNPILLMHPSQSSDQANPLRRKVLPQSASTANAQNMSLSQSLYQQQLQVQQQLLDQCNLAQENPKAMELLAKGKQAFKENTIEAAQKLFVESLKLEPMLLESQYLLGVCYLYSNQYQKAVEQFCDLLEKNEFYKRNVYLLIAIAYKKTNVINAAIQILGKAIQQYPKYYDAFIYRGKLQVKMKRFDKAMADFEMAIRLNASCGLGYMGKADCLRFMNEYNKAIELYSEALTKEEIIGKVAVLKRAITYIEIKNYHLAMTDLQSILDDDPCNSEAYYFKGLLYYKQKNLNEAILSFEQAIKHNNSRKAVTKALFEISKIKIELRDFYQAYHTLQRAEYLSVDVKSLEKFRIFTDGVTFLMKRKHKEGIKHLTNLVKNFSLSDFIKPLVYSYRAYGYFCLSKHSKALSDLQFIETFTKLEKPSLYNKIVCEGILAASNNQFELAMNHFNKAIKTAPAKMEPHFYKAITFIRFSNKLIPKSDEAKRLQFKHNALKSFDKAVELNSANPTLFYHRGLIRFSLNQLPECINDFNEAMKGEDNQAKHHYARGIAYACCMHLKQAVHELSYAIQYNPNLANAYLNRAKCFHLLGEKNSAFLDLQQYISMKQNDPDIHLWAGNLLFNIGAYSDAIKTYSNANGISRNPDILLLRAKCYIVQKDLNFALDDLDRIIDLTVSTELRDSASFDRTCLNSLKLASNASSTSDPTEQESIFLEALTSLKQIKAKLSKSIQGTCFRKSDFYFLKGVYYFYLGDYQKALRNIKKSFELKTEDATNASNRNNAQKRQSAKKNEALSTQGQGADEQQVQPDLSDEEDENILELQEYEFTNRTYNVYEFYFNCAVCYILLGEIEHAYEYLAQLSESLPDQERMKQIDILFQIINDELEQTTETFDKLDEEAIKDIYELQFFPVKNRLCSIFPRVHANFKIYKDFSLSLSFCLPRITPPSMKPCFDESLLEGLLPTVVEEKPEAPWIRKTSDGIMFTENVQHFADLDLKTESTRTSPRPYDENNAENNNNNNNTDSNNKNQNQKDDEDVDENNNHTSNSNNVNNNHLIIDDDDYDYEEHEGIGENDSADELDILASAGIQVIDKKPLYLDQQELQKDKGQILATNLPDSKTKKAVVPFDYIELMKDNSHYQYQDIDDSYEGIDGAEKQSPVPNNPANAAPIVDQSTAAAGIEKSRLKEFLKLDDDIEKRLAKLQKKTQV